MSKDPSFPLYARDWLTATRTMTAPARAAYIDLICHEWLSGPLPDDPELLRRVCAMDRDEFLSIWPEVKAKLTKTQNNQWVSERLETIRDERVAFSEKQRLNGMKGGRPKTHFEPTENPNETQPITQTKPKRNPRANPNHNPKKALLSASASASASPIASSSAMTPNGVVRTDWDEFCEAYPKRSGSLNKADAKKKFDSLAKGEPPTDIIEGAKRYCEWAKATGKFGTELIAQMTTWLNQRRWEEVYDAPAITNGKSTINDVWAELRAEEALRHANH